MRQSLLFTKTSKASPADEVSRNAELLIRGGFVAKEMAGVYSYLPLGLRVYKKIENIIREEMNAIGGQEVCLSTLQDPEIWKKSGRWEDKVVDNWFRTELSDGSLLGLAHSHEEPLTNILTKHVSSYRDLPKVIYQFQNKFRRELRAKSGLLRGREFVMKDMYSFSRDQKGLEEFYEVCAASYLKIFARLGLGDITFRTFASGGSFSKFSDEFQMLCEAGEDTIYLDRDRKLAVNREVYNEETLKELSLNSGSLEEVRAIEVGNIFKLGTRFSEPLGLYYQSEKGERLPVVMGCYGIGLGRLMGAVVEALSDSGGIVWPKPIAPFTVHLISLGASEVFTKSEEVYKSLLSAGVEVLWDDRALGAGEKFADADLLGIPLRVVVSERSLAAGGFEIKQRTEAGTRVVGEAARIIEQVSI